ncbi:hypothetical protein NFO65_12880 [Neorhizobium galegae]|uniref:6-phosphogluconolactonase n=1 Tax=Neorhizobium galegae TaxID=399 RepID=UPI0021017D41|nr:hypothetical protein [Neorhizobium galegae]MCQ1571628.1 hypothetical protein [Neorhizobium galegae]
MALFSPTMASSEFHRVTVFPTADDAADRLLATVKSNPKSVLGLATAPAKAEAVQRSLQADPSAECPASFRQLHRRIHWYLDRGAAAALDQQT